MGSVQVIQIRGKGANKIIRGVRARRAGSTSHLLVYLPRTRRSLLCRVAAEKLCGLRNGLHWLCRYYQCLSRHAPARESRPTANGFRSLHLSGRRLKEPLSAVTGRLDWPAFPFRTAKEAREPKLPESAPKPPRICAPFGSQILGRTEIAKPSAGEKPPLSPFDPLTAAAAIFRPIEHSHFLGSRRRVARSISQTSQ